MITPEEKKEMLTIFRKHYDNLKMRCDIDNATLMLAILPAMQEYAKLNIPAVIYSLPEDATTCIICGEFEPHCKCKDGYERHFLAEQHELLLAKNCYISDVVNQACGDCIYYLTCKSESRDKQICDNYDNEP